METNKKTLNEFSLKLSSPFRRNEYVVFVKHIENGWEINYFGGKIKLDQMCSGIERHLGSDGTKFPSGIGTEFSNAWFDVSKGINLDEIKSNLQRAVDRPV